MDEKWLEQARQECACGRKRGWPLILASVVIWTMVAIVHLTHLPIETKNLITFCCTCPLMPLAWMFSKWLGITFSDKNNPLSPLGIVLSVAQIPYLLIVMWVFAAIPDKMVMTLAMVFGAHLLPFGWLYKSRIYYIMSCVVSIMALLVGLYCSPFVLAVVMVVTEVVFVFLLLVENRNLKSTNRI